MPIRGSFAVAAGKLNILSNVRERSKVLSHACVRCKHYDIAINGGGLVGIAMACSLAKNPKLSNKSVVVFESGPNRKLPKKSGDEEYSNRVISVNPGTRAFFESLGVWKYISDVRYKTVKKMQVWDACSDALITFNDDLINDVSYIVETDVIIYAFQSALSEGKHNVSVEYETKIKNFTIPDSSTKPVKIVTAKDEEHTCSLLIGADGVKSATRAAIGTRYLNWDYDQLAIVATLRLSEPTENVVAWQRFLPTGPIAMLPLNDELSSLVWSTGTEEARRLLELSDESFVDAVNDAFWKMYPKNQIIQSASDTLSKALEFLMLNTGAVRQLPPSVESVLPRSRAAFPLGFGHATEYVARGVALIGDAAHRVHPLAGQGANLGFGDVKTLTEVLAEGAYSGKSIGSRGLLKQYERDRQRHNFPTMIAIDGLHKLYGTTLTPAVVLRSVGLQITHALVPVKSVIMKFASRS